ncbi:MAG: sodium:alanine symporter family protein [Acidobacteria bacterium]|nr:MAG: sodium:alanine symporter family protein [Acidobacteriota bacterium]
MLVDWLEAAAGFIWGPWLLIPLLLLTGLYLTVRLRGLQFTQLGPSLHLALIVRREPDGAGDISHFQALMTALAATVGTGNIVGVATAIALGGPGALFWMWITGLVGMATKYSEALLSVHFRETDPRGEQAGGPMYYLEKGIRFRPLARGLALAFAVFAAVASFGIGNMVQANSIAGAVEHAFGVPTWLTGALLVLAVGLVVLGGIRSIGRFTGVFVPLMVLGYMAGAATILVLHADRLPAALAAVFTGALSGTAAAGGFAGAGVLAAMRYGVARGIFSNESGLGSAGIAAAAAQTREPVRQALVSMTQTFIDTLVVCSFTGLAILVTGSWTEGLDGAALTQQAFDSGLPGGLGPAFVALSLAMFAYSTMLGWCFYGERCIEYLFGARAILPFRIVFVAAVYVGAVRSLDLVWTLSDAMNGLMALPNLVGLLVLSGTIVRLTRSYFAGPDGR